MRNRGCQKDTVSKKVVKEGPWRSYHLSRDLQEVRKPALGISRGRVIQAAGTARAKALRWDQVNILNKEGQVAEDDEQIKSWGQSNEHGN